MRAREYLTRDLVLHIDMLECLRRGSAEIKYEGADGVLLKEIESDLWLISAADEAAGRRLLDTALAGGMDFACVHQEFTKEQLAEKYDFPFYLECFQTAYLKTEPVSVPDICEFRQLTPDMAQWVNEHYRQDPGELDYVRFLLEKDCITGAYVDGKPAGFIGRHSDGSVGLLEVLPEYRRMGIGEALARDALNRELKKGNVPYGQVVWDNEPSLALHRKMGLEFSKTHIWWLELRERV